MNVDMIEEMKKKGPSCKSCLEWHKFCKAECCKIIFLDIDIAELDRPGRFIAISKKIDYDERWYFKLRGVNYLHGSLRFEKMLCTVIDGRVAYVRQCDNLDGFLCRGHPAKKPKLCRELTEETAKTGKFEITKHCRFNFMEVVEDDKK